MKIEEYIILHREDDISRLALKGGKAEGLSAEDMRWALQQIEGWQRTREKLPELAVRADWWYPVRISCEQCSSEKTARYKRMVAQQACAGGLKSLLDLTGGMGIDCYYMAEGCEVADYVERDEELCRLARHNLGTRGITIHQSEATDFVAQVRGKRWDLIYMDPARRDKNGGKVFRLEDCSPNIVDIIDQLRTMANCVMVKLSPMLDTTAALKSLGGEWDIHIVAIKNEVKELLLVQGIGRICAVDLEEGTEVYWTKEEEERAEAVYAGKIGSYLYEPNAALLKGGCYKLPAQRYGLKKLDRNTHLYTGDKLVEGFPGRIFKVNHAAWQADKKAGMQYNVLTRNYGMGAEEMKKRMKIKDGGEKYLIGTRILGKPVVVEGVKIDK